MHRPQRARDIGCESSPLIFGGQNQSRNLPCRDGLERPHYDISHSGPELQNLQSRDDEDTADHGDNIRFVTDIAQAIKQSPLVFGGAVTT